MIYEIFDLPWNFNLGLFTDSQIKFSPSQQGLEYADYIICRGATPSSSKRSVLDMTLNFIW